jgi:hypothetical protein
MADRERNKKREVKHLVKPANPRSEDALPSIRTRKQSIKL